MIKPFGAKCATFIRRSPRLDPTFNILHGAIRSSKTWGVNAKLIYMVTGAYTARDGWQWPGGVGLITGKSKTSIRTNILNDLELILGPQRFSYNGASGELLMCGKPFLVVGASDEGAWKKVRGMTCGIWIADEMTLYPKSFYDIASSRLSLPGSRMYGTTNAASPYHYLKTDVIDNQTMIDAGDVRSIHFTLDDNPNVAEEKKAQYKRMYSGVFYAWYILGEWVVAAGAIYKDALTPATYYTDKERPIGLRHPNGHFEHWISVDYGTINPMVFLDIYDDGDTIWWDEEYYWDSRKQGRQKTDGEYADDLIWGTDTPRWSGLSGNFGKRGAYNIPEEHWPGIIVDPSAASFKAELRTRGLQVVDADNDVANGIRRTMSMLKNNKIRMNKAACPNVVREMQTYAWKGIDETGPLLLRSGKEEPIKEHDHGPDAGRYHIETRISDWRIAA